MAKVKLKFSGARRKVWGTLKSLLLAGFTGFAFEHAVDCTGNSMGASR